MAEDFDRRSSAAFDGAGNDLDEPSASPTDPLAAGAPGVRPARFPQLKADREARVAAIRSWWADASPNLRGSVLMIGAFSLFAVMMTFIKLVGARISMPQMLVIRQLVMTGMLLVIAGRSLPSLLRTDRPGLQVTRGFFSLGAMLAGFTAIVHMPLADATALGFSQVLFVTLAAIFVLHEVVDGRRWIAIGIGFLGVLIMLRPTGEAFNTYAILSIIGAMFGAGITITVRVLGDRENTITILLWQGAVILAALMVPAWLTWQQPTAQEWVWLIGLGVVGLGGQFLITRAYQIGEASALAPLDFVRLLLATLSGYLIFAEVPSLVTIVGATLVVGGTLYTMRRNAIPKPLPDVERP
jgi:drug/metabolite transporter (DMT)-like permease